MNNRSGYKYAGAPLIPSIAEELILELFDGQNVKRKVLVDTVVQSHCERGGLPPGSVDWQCIKASLRNLKKRGLAQNAHYAHWQIGKMPESSGESPQKTPERVNDKTDESPVANPDDTVSIASVESSSVMTLGSGSGVVYVYYYPRDKKFAESEGKSVWECKVGMTESDVDTRIKAQRTTAIYEEPEIGLEIRTDNPRCLERAIHAILELKGRKIDTDGGGNEWFFTSPNEVMIIQILINGI